MDVVGRHAGVAFDRICVASSSSGSGIRSGESRKGTRDRTNACGAQRRLRAWAVSQVDGLRGHHELDRDDARAEVEHLREPPCSERRRATCGPRPPTPASSTRARTRRAGRASRRLGDDRLRGDAELGEPSSHVPSMAVRPSASPLKRGLISFSVRSTAAVGAGASAIRRKSSAAASCADSKFPTDTIAFVGDDDERVSLMGVELDCQRAHRRSARASAARRGAGERTGSSAGPGGSARLLHPRAHCSRVVHAGGRARRAYRGAAGLRPPPGWRTETFPRSASKSSAAAASRTSANARASATASAACAVENAFVASRAPASPAARAKSASAPWARSAFCARSACPGSERPHLGFGAVVQDGHDWLGKLPDEHPGIRRRATFASRDSDARTTSRGASRPSPTRCPAIAERLNAAASSRGDRGVPAHSYSGGEAVHPSAFATARSTTARASRMFSRAGAAIATCSPSRATRTSSSRFSALPVSSTVTRPAGPTRSVRRGRPPARDGPASRAPSTPRSRRPCPWHA